MNYSVWLYILYRDGLKKKNLIKDLVRYFFDLCEILSVYIGIVVKGEIIVILKLLCCDIKYWFYLVYLGYDFMICRVRGIIFWLDM